MQASENRITVVIFAKGVDSELVQAECLNLGLFYDSEDIDGTNTAQHIVKEYKEMLAAYKGVSEYKEISLRIINIAILDQTCQLGAKTATDILTYLCEQKNAVDVVYLPGFRLPVEYKLMEKLQELRKYCVLLCMAKYLCTELPSSEVISIGLQPFQNDVNIASGMLDFMAKVVQERVADPNTNESVARSAGFMAGILAGAKCNVLSFYLCACVCECVCVCVFAR